MKKNEIKNLPTGISDHFKVLENSPMFSLSLSSKELFHSNFIAWLHKAEPNLFIKLVQHWVELTKPSGAKVAEVILLQRENRNFDLRIIFRKEGSNQESQLIIENKVKSIPTPEQLNEYQEKVKNDKIKDSHSLLLTFSEMKSLPEGWKQQNYGKFIQKLRDQIDRLTNGYHKALIEDYCQFTAAFYKIFCFVDSENRYIDRAVMEQAEQFRVHDLLYKHQAAKIACFLDQKLLDHPQLQKNNQPPGIKTGHGMTNATGLVELFYICAEKTFFGVQLQNDQLRLSVESPKTSSDDFTKRFWENDWWKIGEEAPLFKGPSKANKKRINKIGCYEYKNTKHKTVFLYRKRSLSSEEVLKRPEEIADLILDYFERVLENLENIKKAL